MYKLACVGLYIHILKGTTVFMRYMQHLKISTELEDFPVHIHCFIWCTLGENHIVQLQSSNFSLNYFISSLDWYNYFSILQRAKF